MGKVSFGFKGEDGFFVVAGEQVKERNRDVDGWTKVKRNISGESGYIPTSYIHF